ncbi:WD domain, G-beta repeat protein [Teladorsagia circumcincta]|uniref:WD domain, G-beta repeat protein n=1 Tax=Teladorsagia circumcincta TaxID=45464 RepID=A0A2G9UVP1_TELCI|nr:WD domain, G-beta repeat protein [Teladorsagia circumcincta]
MSVRSACFAPQCSNVFATGGRDGQIRLWDARISSLQQQGQFLKKSVNVYKNAHLIKGFRSPSTKRAISRLSNRFEKAEPPSVTSLLYANDYTLISASSCGKSGLRLWDTRRISVKDEGQVLSTLEVPTNKDAGVTSICLDRFGSSLFAAVTDNCVYEYGILTSHTKPLRHFTGATIESFYVQLQCSPSADYLLCGSKNQQAVIWDLQDLYGASDKRADMAERRCRALLPKYTLKGHDSEVCCVGWSQSGKYMVSMDDQDFRVWSADNVNPSRSDTEAGSAIETISTYELNESEKTTLLVNRYPTENLPNKVYERYIAKFKAKRLAETQTTPSTSLESQPPSTSKKNIDDFCVRGYVDRTKSQTKQGRPRFVIACISFCVFFHFLELRV